MMREPNKRSRRIPFSTEELSNIIAYRKYREQLIVLRFKKTWIYIALNVFNICCIFVYLELIFCYFGPCNYTKHYSANTITKYGFTYDKDFKPIVDIVDIYGVNGKLYQFIVQDFIEVPQKKISFIIGSDYLLQKDLKGILDGTGARYRLFSASPVLFLCFFISFICFMAFLFNLNESVHPLSGLTTINAFTLLGIILI